jgi:hypothetical protein
VLGAGSVVRSCCPERVGEVVGAAVVVAVGRLSQVHVSLPVQPPRRCDCSHRQVEAGED